MTPSEDLVAMGVAIRVLFGDGVWHIRRRPTAGPVLAVINRHECTTQGEGTTVRGKVLLLVAWLGVVMLLTPDSAAPQAFTQRPVADGNFEGAISVCAVALRVMRRQG